MPKLYSLTDRQLRAIQILVYEGKNKGQTAKEVGVDPGIVSDWFKTDLFLNALNAEMRRSFQESAIEAKRVQMDLLNNAESENVKATMVKDILSRAGFDATTKVENTNTDITVSLVKKDEHIG
jgi:hypothetical protein